MSSPDFDIVLVGCGGKGGGTIFVLKWKCWRGGSSLANACDRVATPPPLFIMALEVKLLDKLVFVLPFLFL